MRTIRTLSLAVAGLLLVAVVFASTPNSPKKPQKPVGVINRTKAFEILKAEQVNDEISLTLKNQDTRWITGFSIKVGPNITITEELVFVEELDDTAIKPQAIFTRTYPIPLSLQQSPFDVVFRVAVFDDGTGDGDIPAYLDIKEARLGKAIQLRRALKTMQTVSNSERTDFTQLKSDLTRAFEASDSDTLRDLLELVPTGIVNRNSNGPLSDMLKEGLAGGRHSVLNTISESMTSDNSKKELLRIKRSYERMLSRLKLD